MVKVYQRFWKRGVFAVATVAIAGGFAALGGAATYAQEAQLDPSDPGDAMTIARKIQCSTVDGQPIVYSWSGQAFSRRTGEADRHLFDVEGMNIRACSERTDETRGRGYALVSREILLYLDKETGEPLSKWENPLTGETVDVLHVANDPVNFRSFERNANGEPVRWSGEMGGGQWWWRVTVPLWYTNPLAGDFQAEIGGAYHATEMFNFFGSADELLNPETPTAPAMVGWARMSDWLPWMNMGGRDGLIYFHTAGEKLGSFDELSDVMKAEIATHYPEYASPPPLDDDRRNMTSWKYYLEIAQGEREAPQR